MPILLAVVSLDRNPFFLIAYDLIIFSKKPEVPKNIQWK